MYVIERQLFVFDLLLLCEWYQLSEGELLLEGGLSSDGLLVVSL